MKYELHYAAFNLTGDIPCAEFKEFSHLITYIDGNILNRVSRKPVIYLMAITLENQTPQQESEFEILVTKFPDMVGRFLILLDEWALKQKHNAKIFLQEYESFEDAYKVALDMRECSPLCYSS